MGKARTAGVSASSFLDLKAELSKAEDEFKKAKASGSGGRAEPIVGGVKREGKKPSVWAQKNKGVADRAKRDMEVELEEVSRSTMESARAALEKKSKIYEKLQKGMTGGLNDKQYDSLLVDVRPTICPLQVDEGKADIRLYWDILQFDRKAEEDRFEAHSSDEDESLTVPRPAQGDDGDEDDPMVEYEDEFGRTRRVRRSEAPRGVDILQEEDEEPEVDPYVIYNPVGHFPTYEPTLEKQEAIAAAFAEARKDPLQHYDASKEYRARGAGFYQFATGDEEARQKQMEELKNARLDTMEKREELGVEDGVGGEGAAAGGEKKTTVNRAVEKRKREIEERRKLIEAKKRKVVNEKAEAAGNLKDAAAAASTPPSGSKAT
ncbi:hypothetical protein FRC04_000491 [Tulasnella sp. 424]|nr:hypothetical protein FRC04_000491 [Tulasnella sp. 424]